MADVGRKSDHVFFFGYVQLSNEERKYSAANPEAAKKLTEINGMLIESRIRFREVCMLKHQSFSAVASQLLECTRSCFNQAEKNFAPNRTEELWRPSWTD